MRDYTFLAKYKDDKQFDLTAKECIWEVMSGFSVYQATASYM